MVWNFLDHRTPIYWTRKICKRNSKGLSSSSIKINHLKRNKSTTTRSQSFVPHQLHSKSLHQFHIHLCVFRSLLFYRTQYRCAISYHQNSTNSVQKWIMVDTRLTHCSGSPWTIRFVSCWNIYHFSLPTIGPTTAQMNELPIAPSHTSIWAQWRDQQNRRKWRFEWDSKETQEE